MSVKVGSEPLTYERASQQANGVSYYRDLLFREQDAEARVRLERHGREMDVEFRTNPSRVQGKGGYFAPPLWLIDMFATAPRAKRVLAKMIDKEGNCFPLPPGVQSINLPRVTTGNAEQPSADNTATPETDLVDAAATSPVATISGQADVPLPLLEQSPAGAHLDVMFFRDLTEAYDAQLETQLFTGTGPNTQPTPQFTGLLNLSGVNTVTYTSGSPTATNIFASLGSVIAKIGNTRKLPPEAWLMTTSRAGWLGSSEDQQQRPLMIADNTTKNGEFDLLAFRVGMSDVIPTNLSGNPGSFTSGGTQDVIIACRPSDMMLWESQPTTMVGLEVLSGSLQARLQLRAYAAFICRYPTAVTVLGGTGLAVQTGF
jgi:HK97 family phage major capsid protein